jgi:ATP-dependent Zn protease
MATIVKTKRCSDDVEVAQQLRATAWHEAGHVVAALVLGRSVTEVSIVPSYGRCGPR